MSGTGGSASKHAQLTGFSALADREGFLVIYPNGVQGLWRYGNSKKDEWQWMVNTTSWAFNYVNMFTEENNETLRHDITPDDNGWMRHMIHTWTTRKAIDSNRVFVTGQSAGGLMASRVCQESADLVAGCGVVCGNLFLNMTATPHALHTPSHPVSLIELHGDADAKQPYCGYHTTHREFGAADVAFHFWRGVNQCGSVEAWDDHFEPAPLQVCDNSSEPTATVGLLASQCARGSEVRFYRIANGIHEWWENINNGSEGNPLLGGNNATTTTEVVWEFLSAHPRPAVDQTQSNDFDFDLIATILGAMVGLCVLIACTYAIFRYALTGGRRSQARISPLSLDDRSGHSPFVDD